MDKIGAPYILSLIAGILILIGGIVSFVANIFARYVFEISGWGGMMGPGIMEGWPSMMGFGWGFGIFTSIVGIVIGIIVLYSTTMLRAQPVKHEMWGILILIFSILSFFGALAGFGIGLLLGIIGGALAISWKPAEASISTLTSSPQTAVKFCFNCGKPLSKEAKYCPNCGQQQQPA